MAMPTIGLVEMGHFLLLMAFAVAVIQSVVPMIGAARDDSAMLEVAKPAALGQFACLTLAFAVLMQAYIISDFSVANVATNSHSSKPMIYKISGTWGNHEGSLVLWVWILALFGAGVAVLGRNLPDRFKARVLAVQGMIGLGFLAFIVFTSNPFERLDPAPLDGQGLNPILQDPGLAIHPPMLYLGYVGFSTTFSFAIAALLEGRIDPTWARWMRPWTLAAWTFLTLGIALGSWWAYYELGWGGYWFWDPVENASFMPWLAGTALLHSAIVVEKRNTLKSWTILLAILTFSLSLLGTFLVRSGVLTSVHAFATDPERGVFILALLVIAVGGSLLLYAWRAPSLESGGIFSAVSREGSLLLNNLLLATAAATVLLGTLYPLFLDALGGPKISVGPPYFNATFLPLMIPLAIVLPIGVLMAWKRGNLPSALRRALPAVIAMAVIATVIVFLVAPKSAMATFGIAIGVWVIAGSVFELLSRAGFPNMGAARVWNRLCGLPRAAFAMTVAHIGLGVLILGVTVSSTAQVERILTLAEGETVDLAGYDITLASISDVRGPNYVAERATFDVSRGGSEIATLFSERRFFPVERNNTTEAGIDTGLLRDIYLVIGEEVEPGRFNVRLYYNPLAFWIWGGAGLMGIAGLISLADRRHRIGAPQPARSRRPADAQA